jgi:hypothetical protein
MRPSSRKRARRPARNGIASAIFDLCLASRLSGVYLGRCLIGLRRRIGERQQFVDSAHWMPGDDLCEHVPQIGIWIDAIHFAGFDERRDNGPMLTAAIRSGEEKIFAVM